MFKHGLFDHPVTAAPMDLPDAMLAGDAAVSRAAAEQSIVLLKNDGRILPLARTARRIVVIGGNADKGVIAGGGSSLVYPKGGNATPDIAPKTWPGPVMFYPSSPLEALRRQLPNAEISFVDGRDPVAAAAQARTADIAVVFATQWAGESFDVSLSLKDDQDALIDTVATANPKTVVVLETGGPILTPWAGKTAGILETWYPGTAGGDAIANVLTGKVNPSGHLPVTFPNNLAQLPHPEAPVKGDVQYSEGAAVGYKWYDRQNLKPAFAFGHGLSYTRFGYRNLSARIVKREVAVKFTVQNQGATRGMAVAQVYAAGDGWEAPRRLAAFRKVDLTPGQSRAVTLTLDPRLLADFDTERNCWRLRSGSVRLTLGDSSAASPASATLSLTRRAIGIPNGFCRPG
jgi:beta-glucosidase